MKNFNNNTNPVKLITIILIITLLGVMAQFASDNYLPSLPAIAHYFSATSDITRLSISVYFLGLCLSQLIYGPLSDVYGRKPVLMIGFVIFLCASLIASLAPTMNLFLFSRLLQGVGMGSAISLYRPILRDIASGERFAKISSYIMMIAFLTPPLAPITGGYIQQFFGWRENFLLVTLLSFIIGMLIWRFMPETLPSEHRTVLSAINIIRAYKRLLANRIFIGNAICSSMILSMLIAYLVVTAFLYQDVLGLSPVAYGWLTIFYAAMMMLGGFINSQFVSKLGINKMTNIGIACMLIGALVMLILGLAHFLNVFVILIPMMLILISAIVIFINLMALAFDHVQDSIGTAGAVYGCVNATVLTVISAFAAYLPAQNQIPLAVLLLIIPLILILIRLKIYSGKI